MFRHRAAGGESGLIHTSFRVILFLLIACIAPHGRSGSDGRLSCRVAAVDGVDPVSPSP